MFVTPQLGTGRPHFELVLCVRCCSSDLSSSFSALGCEAVKWGSVLRLGGFSGHVRSEFQCVLECLSPTGSLCRVTSRAVLTLAEMATIVQDCVYCLGGYLVAGSAQRLCCHCFALLRQALWSLCSSVWP